MPSTSRVVFLGQGLLALAALLLAGAPAARAATKDLHVQAQLVWGTDGDKPPDPEVKRLDDETRKKLGSVFKWKNYFEVERQNFKVTLAAKQKVRLSPKCEVEVENLGGAQVEVKLYGEGKMVVKKRQVLKAGELLILAGDDKNQNAWFVIITPSSR
jgi:hypothetical protein